MPDNATTETEKYMKQLKRRMECWREIVLHGNSILVWEKSWYPGLILALTTSVYLFIWLLEPAFLTVVALCLLTCALVDYLGPIIASTFFSSSAWNGQKERKFDEICQTLSSAILHLEKEWKSILNARNNRPHIYYGSITLCLLLLAWAGNAINNLLLIYLTVNGILLTPGLRYKCRGEYALKYAFNYITRRKLWIFDRRTVSAIAVVLYVRTSNASLVLLNEIRASTSRPVVLRLRRFSKLRRGS